MIELANDSICPLQRSTATFWPHGRGACDGNLDAGLKAMEAEFHRVSRLGPLPVFYVGLMARVRLEAGQAAQALELLDDILKTVREPGVGIYVPEIHRLRGECLLRLHPGDFAQAIRNLKPRLDGKAAAGAHLSTRRGLQPGAGVGRRWPRGTRCRAVARGRRGVRGDSDAAQLAQAREWLAAHS